MPYLKIQTNQAIADAIQPQLLAKASGVVSKALGKQEKYVMVSLEERRPMLFAGSPDPCAFLELKSIGLPQSQTEEISRSLCQFMEEYLKIPAERAYIEFAAASGPMWGWNEGTF